MSNLVVTAAQHFTQVALRSARQIARSYIRRSIRHYLDGRTFEGPRLETFHLLTSRDGAPMPRVYGRARLAGEVIWASRLKEHVTEERVGKGGPRQRNYSYTISFAIGLCEGEIAGVERLWVNGAILPTHGLTFRVHKGMGDQLPDPIISAIEGGEVPAFRGTAYMVFEDFPLDDYGARLPQINAEVLRLPPSLQKEPRLEDYVTGVNLIPSSGEYAYATDIIEDVTGPGAAVPINVNNLSGQSDITHALDQLETQLPHCRNVSLIISWFGTSLDVGECEIKPGVESRERLVSWKVSGDARGTAYLVSQTDGRPNYGGTPSDNSIIQALRTLKSRGFRVTIYPFILMDSPGFPWRGRISSDQDMSGGVVPEIDRFFGNAELSHLTIEGDEIAYNGPSEYGFRRFILHHAKLAELAGGVDRFVIGSEMRGLTRLRSELGVYPSVDKLKDLAADVRTILGPDTGLTYAADWSEYFGHQSGGDIYYHLDPLWADPNIDAVGIDAYFPLSDWRDGEHLDQDVATSIYDLDYLKYNMEGGEGYDWYYANPQDRAAQIRTPITDPVYRYKDIRHWWSQPHFNRTDGAVEAIPTKWVPESKPIWFTEIGCPAIDKGSNQPNVFVDPKSVESYAPYHSSGTRDDLIQRRYLEAFITYWQDNNETSSVYGGPMVDMEAAHVWCWDARPYPDFPARRDVWADGPNWQVGHWLSGRTGLVPLHDVIRDLANVEVNVDHVHGIIEGYVIDRPMSALAAIEPLLALYDINMIETASGLSFVSSGLEDRISLSLDNIVFDNPGLLEIIKTDPEIKPRDVRLHYIDTARDFQGGSISARDRLNETEQVIDITAPIAMGEGAARQLAEHILSLAIGADERVEFNLSPACLNLEIGDVLSLPNLSGQWRVESLDGVSVRRAIAQKVSGGSFFVLSGSNPETAPPVPWVGKPVPIILDIPNLDNNERAGPLVGAIVTPFNPIKIYGPDGHVVVDAPVAVGALLTALPKGPVGRWDRASQIEMQIAVDLSSALEDDVLNGANRFAVETQSGWEIIQIQNIELIGANHWLCSNLLRGAAGSDADMMESVPAGARVVYLDQGLETLPIDPSRIDENISLTASAAGRESDELLFTYQARYLRPLSPAHGKVEYLDDGTVKISWIRRTRIGGDSWAGFDVPLGEDVERYRIEFWAGDILSKSNETETAELVVLANEVSAATDIRISQASQSFGYGSQLIVNLS